MQSFVAQITKVGVVRSHQVWGLEMPFRNQVINQICSNKNNIYAFMVF